MQEFGVHSEVGQLRKVMVHRPGLDLQRLTPSNHEDLLFDDVVWVERAQQQHDAFAAIMRDHGVEVFYHEQLLAEALANPEARSYAINRTVTPLTVGPSIVEDVRQRMRAFSPADLASHLVEAGPSEKGISLGRETHARASRQAAFVCRRDQSTGPVTTW